MRSLSGVLLLAAAASAARLVEPGPGLRGKPEFVQGEYIVVLKNTVAPEVHSSVTAKYAARKFAIGSGPRAFRAMHAKLSDGQLAEVLAHPEVDFVERNQIAHVADVPVNASKRISCPATQTEPLSWGQKRVTAQSAGDVEEVFAHDPNWGNGVTVYVLDTGVRITHEEFGGRAEWGANFAGGADQDNNGHGTHCAGTIGGKTYGLAKAATIVAVKVLGDSGSGSYDGIISGVEWTVSRGKKAIANMSLGGGYSAALNQAVNAAASAGVLFANAAGNDNRDSCSYSPASAEDGICVGSTELASKGGQQIDSRSYFSNYGSCTHVFAPGSAIDSAYRGSDSAYATLSGTSMAAPHVAGVAAIALQANPGYSAAQIKNWITSKAMSGLIENPGTGSPNLMLHVEC
eukprot:TRINITY_DN1753_c0_g1_i10.p2 TRINITY_DN1753_c0_g1~~TRINITY_DN1753_c0_g1_i10.p2  ORF type:complete len:403 (+),score=144.46 TRINITY_DN1753_c0_g1_i10:76-1284(+)